MRKNGNNSIYVLVLTRENNLRKMVNTKTGLFIEDIPIFPY